MVAVGDAEGATVKAEARSCLAGLERVGGGGLAAGEGGDGGGGEEEEEGGGEDLGEHCSGTHGSFGDEREDWRVAIDERRGFR